MAGRSLDKVKNAYCEIQDSDIKGSLSTVQLDVTDESSIQQALKTVQDTHGQLDVLINNAAVGCRDPDVKTRMQLSMDTNVVGPAMIAAAFRPMLLKSCNPYSIWVSSGAGSLTRASENSKHLENEDAYRASKAAVNMLAVIEARDFGPKGLKTFAFCPGFVVSNLRGTSEEARTGWGGAGDPMVSGKTILSIIQGNEMQMLASMFTRKVFILGRDSCESRVQSTPSSPQAAKKQMEMAKCNGLVYVA